MPQLEILMNTPQAFANFSPGFEAQREPWVTFALAMQP